MAVAFSPNFNSDSVMTAITYVDTGLVTDTANVSFQMYSTSTAMWNNAAGFGTGYPVVIATGGSAAVTGITAADITLAPTYLGSDDAERIAFAGLALTGTSGTAKSGVVRLKDTSDKLIDDGALMKSVSYDGTNLVAGRYDNNYVRRTDEALVTTPTFSTARSLKRPQGANHVIVAWADGNVIAGTSGNESAFCVSEDNGKTFNGISLVDSHLTNIEDVGTSSDGSLVYMATDNGTDLSIWRKDASWERVLSVTGSVGDGFIIRTAPGNPDIVYAAQKSSQTIYYSQDAGETKWFTRTSKYALQDLTVESDDVAYIAQNGTAAVSKTTNGGFTWGSTKATELVSGSIHTILSISEDNLIVGGTDGYVSYSTDGGSNWNRVLKVLESGAGTMQIAASGLADGDYVYATSSENGTDVRRWTIGGTSWKALEATTAVGTMGATGISLFNGALYVAVTDGNDSEILRTLSPTASVPLSSYWSTTTSAGETFNRDPSSLKVTTSGDNTKLWAIDNAGAGAADDLFYYTDILASAGPTLLGPADGALISVNPITGYANDTSLTWEQPPKGRSYTYDVKVALDSGFKESIVSTTKTSSSSIPNYKVDGTEFSPGTTYYWRIRVATDGPIQSPYSEVRTLTIEPSAAMSPAVLAPQNGASGIALVPAFSWGPVAGAAKYEFQLAVAPHAKGWKTPVYAATIAETGIVPTVKLDNNLTYFWRVRAVSPIEGSWSAIANFTTLAEPTEAVPPVVVQEVPAPVINIPPAPAPQQIVIPPAPPPPAPIAPTYIWAIIIIGAVLVIAVIVLIVRTRRAV